MLLKNLKYTAVLALVLLGCLLLSACGTPAPSGMYHPVDTEKYVNGVDNFTFSVPEDFTVTMSSNMLAAVNGDISFTVQTRHSDYYYKGGLEENYKELKNQLTALYGDYTETKNTEVTVADRPALRVDYRLTVAGTSCGYVQYLFYNGTTAFYLFTYSYKTESADEALLQSVLETVSFDSANPILPEGFKVVANATAESLRSDKYLLYCPDEWVFDNTLGQICMRVPSSSIISNISLNEITFSDTLASYVTDYTSKVAPGIVWAEGMEDDLEKYILASLYQMAETLPEFKIGTVTEEEDGEDGDLPAYKEFNKDELVASSGQIVQTLTSKQKILVYYVDFSARLADHKDHGSGGLFDTGKTEEEENGPASALYSFRQCFIVKDGTLYFFTYTASPSQFNTQLEDFDKVIDNFELIEKKK